MTTFWTLCFIAFLIYLCGIGRTDIAGIILLALCFIAALPYLITAAVLGLIFYAFFNYHK